MRGLRGLLTGLALLWLAGCSPEERNRALHWVGQSTYQRAPEYKPWAVPQDPRHKAAMDEAHALKLPASVPKPTDCAKNMTRKECFEHLCPVAGEFVFETVPKVEGVYEMRPLPSYLTQEQRETDWYATEDPYDDDTLQVSLGQEILFTGPLQYRYYDAWRDEIGEEGWRRSVHPSYYAKAPERSILRYSGYNEVFPG